MSALNPTLDPAASPQGGDGRGLSVSVPIGGAVPDPLAAFDDLIHS